MRLLNKYSWTKHIDFIIIDTIVLVLAFWVSYVLVFDHPFFWLTSEWPRYLLFVLSLNIALTFITRPYSSILRRPYYMEIVRSFQLTITNMLIATFVFYLLKVGAMYSRGTSFYMYGLYFVFSALFNILWKKLLLSGVIVVETVGRISLFIIGDSSTIEETVHNVAVGDFVPYDIKGIHLVDDANDGLRTSLHLAGENIPLINQSYCEFILRNNIQDVLVAVPPSRVESGVLERLHANAVNVNLVVESTLGFLPEDQYFNDVGIYKALAVGAFSFEQSQLIYLVFKRAFDIVFGLLGLIFLVPISLLVKIAYLISGDKDKIFYRQTRVGQNGKIIHIWKFRSMVPNADEMLEQLLQVERYNKEWGKSQKLENDPRVTRVGVLLRKTSLDELPQLLNVLVGDMSLVGPRPLVRGELESHGGLKLYQRVKPGITGWWACNGRSNIDYRERLELEYYYVKHCSMYLDVLCLLRTVVGVIKRDGAV